MSLIEKAKGWFRSRTLLATLMRRGVPVLVLFMLFVTGVPVMASRNHLLGNASDAGAWPFWRVVLLTGLAELICLITAIYLLLQLYRSLTRPLSNMAHEMSALVFSSSETTTYGTIRTFDELVALSAAFDRLFRLQQTRIRESDGLASAVLHDLRTPLTHIRNEAELAYRGVKLPMEAIYEIADTCDNMLELVDMDAEISNASMGLDEGMTETVDIAQTIMRSLDIFAPIAEAKTVRLDYTPSPTVIRIQGRAGQIQRLVSNLLDNAVKYTPAGGRVSIATAVEDQHCRISVSDTGIGISPEDHSRIFKRFYRAGISRNEPGHGLGLSLVSAIVEAHAGEISCTSIPDKGTTFFVRLPLVRAVQPEPIQNML